MVGSYNFAESIATAFRRQFVSGTVCYTLPEHVQVLQPVLARAGLRVSSLKSEEWPFPSVIDRIRNNTNLVQQVGGPRAEFHDFLRDTTEAALKAARNFPIAEVYAFSRVFPAAAVFDLLVQPFVLVAPPCMWEFKTGNHSNLRPNQSYIYALGLTGGHITTLDIRVEAIGLKINGPLPQMDFILMICETYGATMFPCYVPCSIVNIAASTAALTASVEAVRQLPFPR